MNCDLHSSAISKGESCLKQTVTCYNLALGTIRTITNAPCIPLSNQIHHYLSSLIASVSPQTNKNEDDFRNQSFPYQNHLYIAIAVQIMQRSDIKPLLAQLYTEDDHYISHFLSLSGINWGIPCGVNQDIFAQLVSVLHQGGALKEAPLPTRHADSHIPREIVLLNFFSSFISPRLFTPALVNEGVKGVLMSAITLISPVAGGVIKMIDGFNPLTTLFPHRTNNISRLVRDETNNITTLKSVFSFLPTGKQKPPSHDYSASASATTVNTPLLVGSATLALTPHPQCVVKTMVGITSIGLAGAYTLYRYFSSPPEFTGLVQNNDLALNSENNNLTHSVFYPARPASLSQLNPNGRKKTCYDIERAIQELLSSNKNGLRLVDELCHFIFDQYSDLNISHARRLLKKWEIKNFGPHDRTEMSVLLTHILSVLLTPAGKKEVFDLNNLIFLTGEEVNQIWLRNLRNRPQETINDALKEIRLFVSARLVKELGAVDLTKADKLIDYIVLLCAPDLIQFHNNNKGNLDVVSKEGYYYWNYLGKEYSDNNYVYHQDFNFAIEEGRKYGFYLRRRKFYDGIEKLSPVRELFENFTSSINQEFINYHEKDVKLEQLIFPTFDDIIEDAYREKGVTVFTPINFDRESLRVNLQPYIDKDDEVEYLRKCKDIRQVIRSFPDGMDVLRRRLPNLVPYSLRSYTSDDSSLFVLRPHPKRDELKESHERIYQEICQQHKSLYKDVVRMAFEMDPNYHFFSDPLVQISVVKLDSRRIQKIRTMFMPKSFRFHAQTMLQAAYNPRKHYQRGVIFIAEHTQTKEKRFFAANIEASRIYRQLPIISLNINKTEDIARLSNEFLDGHYKFHDGKPFWDPCDEQQAFKTSLLSPPEEAWNYITERLQFVKSIACKATRSEKEIVPLFTEKKLGNSTAAIQRLQKEMLDMRDEYLAYEKEEIDTSRETDRERDLRKGKWQLFKEKLPLYSCIEMVDDLLVPHEDIVLTSLLENVFQGVLCASDAYLISSLAKKLTGLEQALKKLFLQKTRKKIQLDALNNKLAVSQSALKLHPSLEISINNLRSEIVLLNRELKSTYDDIFLTGVGLAAKPTEVIYPLFSFGSGKTFIFPLAAGIGKKELKEFKSGLKSYTFYPWIKPSAKELLEKEHHILSSPERKNITCYSDDSQPLNITTNIFHIHEKHPILYQKIFFAMLKNPDIQTIIDTADSGGWKIADNYDEMAMFCFRSFIAPVWHYIGEIIDLEKHYNLNPNENALNAGLFFDYLNDNLISITPFSNLILTADQNLLIRQSVKAINSTLESDLQAFQFNYLFTLKQILLSENIEALLRHSDITEKEINRNHKTALQNMHYKLGKTTLYSTHSAIQEKFHRAVINHFTQAMTQTIRERPSAITLFSANIETFNYRCAQYRQLHPNEAIPSLAEFIRHQIWMENEFERIYQPFARIEYSAKVLANYTEDKWLSADAQTDWLDSIHEYLPPQLHSQNLKPYLKDVTRKVLTDWQHEQHQSASKDALKLIISGNVNPIFISLVQSAMQQYCATYPKLLFCQLYQIDNGSRFTFLKNDFVTEAPQRSRRQLFSEHPFYPLPLLEEEKLTDIIISSSPRWQPENKRNNTRQYHKQLNVIVHKFIYFSFRPFHERLYGFTFTTLAPEDIAENDAATLINTLIDDSGNFIASQRKVLQRYLPSDAVIDTDRMLKLLSDILRLVHPSAPDLYEFVFRQLQSLFNSPGMTLTHLTDRDFITTQARNLTQRYQQQLKVSNGVTSLAINRYMTAAIQYHLAFARYLTAIDTEMADMRLKEASAQQLCLGAIIAQHLQLESASHVALRKLFSIAMQDAGIIPVSAHQQIALLTLPGRHSGEDTLHCLASCLENTASRQLQLVACVNASQQLAAYLTELQFDPSSAEQQQQLQTLVQAAIQSQQQLLTSAMPANLEQPFRLARDRGTLRLTWYLTTGRNNSDALTVAAIGFNISDQDKGILFPYSLPLPLSGTFRQRPTPQTDEALTAICFDPGIRDSVTFNFTTVTPPAVTQRHKNDSIIATLSDWMTLEAGNQLRQFTSIHNEADFVRTKNAMMNWLLRHLPFTGSDNLLAEQLKSERIIKLASQPTVNKWKMRTLAKPQNMSTAHYLADAITDVMGEYTDWPADASELRTRNARVRTLSADELPMTGFRGVWWDPMNAVCYLGFINENDRQLYATLGENREILYPLTDESVHSRIWAALSLHNELQDDYAALRRGHLTAQKFFEQSVPVAWQQHNGNATEHWHLIDNKQASQLLRQGILTPHRYLQRADGRNDTRSQLTPYALQHHSGKMVFIFSESDNQIARYCMLNLQGELQALPARFADWPHLIRTSDHVSSKLLFNATIESFLDQEQREILPGFQPLLNDTQRQQQKSALSGQQATLREHYRLISNITANIPFRTVVNAEGLIDIDVNLKRHGRTLNDELQKRIHEAVEFNDRNWNIFAWREDDLYDDLICNNTLKVLKKKQALFTALNDLVTHDPFLTLLRTAGLISWIDTSMAYLVRIIAAIEWFRSPANLPVPADNLASGLHLDALAKNMFFRHYGEQPYVTPELFAEPWEFSVERNRSILPSPLWQRALDQLRLIATALPDNSYIFNQFLSLPDNLSQVAQMQTYANQFQHALNSTLSYWRQPHKAQHLLLIRPQALMSTRNNHPPSLIVTAGAGHLTAGEPAPAISLSPEQFNDILLVQPGESSELRLAGINSDPMTAEDFATWSKSRFAGPVFMNELSGPAFLYRLQNTIEAVIATESQQWSTEERDFYASPATTRFLQLTDFDMARKSHYHDFFRALFASDVLVTRLILPDVEMVFGLLCDYWKTRYPERAGEDVSLAWFLFKNTYADLTAESHGQPIWLLGV
ncbi:hypothetical protein [Pantoea cypripedii]|uniref:hypothetical protein n=1 Tax=Pantoea cypripedii TaxID=55209 RepID=UPI001AE89546|nr:hypothetical protein [Pantoea cypripedii]MBP2199622.1 hypothetical protein [Pantoea cypripedii]